MSGANVQTTVKTSTASDWNFGNTLYDRQGHKGSADGQFKNPWDVATDATGNVCVADTANGRVQKFR